MKPGPTEIHKCPSCTKLLKKKTLLTWNTLGAKSYSDGKVISGMSPEYPIITICPRCKTIFWMDEETLVGEYWYQNENKKWKNLDYADFLTIEESFIALERNIFAIKGDEYFIRNHILWSFNDRVRKENKLFVFSFRGKVREKEKLFNSDYEQALYENNIKSMITLLKGDTDNDKIMLAELNRNLGNFNLCMELLRKLEDPELERLITAFGKECEKMNRIVFLLD